MTTKPFILVSSYHVEIFSVEDIKLYGPFGLKLVPFNDTHRCWYFIAEDEDNKKEWEEVLYNCNCIYIFIIYIIS